MASRRKHRPQRKKTPSTPTGTPTPTNSNGMVIIDTIPSRDASISTTNAINNNTNTNINTNINTGTSTNVIIEKKAESKSTPVPKKIPEGAALEPLAGDYESAIRPLPKHSNSRLSQQKQAVAYDLFRKGYTPKEISKNLKISDRTVTRLWEDYKRLPNSYFAKPTPSPPQRCSDCGRKLVNERCEHCDLQAIVAQTAPDWLDELLSPDA
jgi:hypothetical protein